MTEPKPYPSFNPQDFPACQEHAQKALQLAVQALKGAATSGPGQQELLQKELAYAEAQVARFANGTAMEPERAVAQQRYAELMEGIGVLPLPSLSLPVHVATSQRHFVVRHVMSPDLLILWLAAQLGIGRAALVCTEAPEDLCSRLS